MTTTAASRHRPATGPRVLLATALVAVLAGGAIAVAGALLGGSPAAWGGMVGTVVTAAVLLGGALVVDVVAGVLPSASLVVALLTYALQVTVLLAVVTLLSGSGLLDGTLSRAWVATGVVAATLAWLGALTVTHRRARVPAYDVAVPTGAGSPEVGA